MITARNTTPYVSALLFFCAATLAAQKLHRHPFVGNVTDSSATVSVWLESAGSFSLRYGVASDLAGAQRTAPVTASAAEDFSAKAELRGLLPATRYYYRVTDAGGLSTVSAIQSFKTFPKSGADAPFTLLFGSCQQKTDTDAGKVFGVAKDFGGDVFVQLGDWTYPDARVAGYPGTDSSIRASYELRLDTLYPFSRLMLSQMGLAYCWDDNDYTRNNGDGGGDSTTKRKLLSAYRRYIPHYPLANQSNGIWHSFLIGNAEVFMIDSRSQRRPNGEAFQGGKFAPPAGHSMLAGYPVSGTNQRAWLLDAIRKSKARWKIVISPVYFNPATISLITIALQLGSQSLADEASDKWIGFPEDIDSLKALFSAGYGRNLIILSGDAHINVFDNGTHSVVPEFMVGNLDNVASSNPFATLQALGLSVWTGVQTGSKKTIGRLRVETAPVHKLIVESFDEDGGKMLSYEMTDNTVGIDRAGTSAVLPGVVTATCQDGRALRLKFSRRHRQDAKLMLYSVTGIVAMQADIVCDADGGTVVQLPAGLANGMYLGRIVGRGESLWFKVALTQ